MPRKNNTGRLAVNFTLEEHAYEILKSHAPHKRAYGEFLCQLLRDYVQRQDEMDLRHRIEQLERRLAPVGGSDEA